MPTNTYTPLATVTLTGTDSEIVFASIPSTYRDLIVVMTPIGSGTANDSLYLKLNTSTADFSYVQMYGDGSGKGSNSGSGGRFTNYYNSTGRVYNSVLQVMDYSATDKHKTYLSRFNADNSGVGAFAGRWAQTTAVNSLSIYPGAGSFAIGSTFSLYGVIA
jgi:hypothetical protein